MSVHQVAPVRRQTGFETVRDAGGAADPGVRPAQGPAAAPAPAPASASGAATLPMPQPVLPPAAAASAPAPASASAPVAVPAPASGVVMQPSASVAVPAAAMLPMPQPVSPPAAAASASAPALASASALVVVPAPGSGAATLPMPQPVSPPAATAASAPAPASVPVAVPAPASGAAGRPVPSRAPAPADAPAPATASASAVAGDSGSEGLLALRDSLLHQAPVELVALADVTARDTPRTGGVDGSWALTLAEVETELPPILVHRPTMTVIDGLHRLRAAQLRGRERIAARFFDGSAQDAALLAVAVNVAQGRPLSQADRVAAVERIVTVHPYWSDRAIAAIAGLSAKKVSEVRQRSGDPAGGERRIGLDGRARPLNAVQGRELAGELLRADPTASLRTVARKAGISPVTVADVRDRLLRGDDPVTERQRGLVARRAPREQVQPQARGGAEGRSPGELSVIFHALRRDPSLRLTEDGRTVLRMLEACSLLARDRRRIIASLPPHCTGQMAALVGGYSELWREFADELRACEEQQRAGVAAAAAAPGAGAGSRGPRPK